MKIAVISDSHNDNISVKAINKYLKDVDMILHCGDGASDIDIIAEEFNGEIYAVRGNCDISNLYPLERIIEVKGKRIFITHGHRYNVKYEYNTIFYKGKEIEADIVLFGHSHKHIVERVDGITIMNPGSISLPYGRAKKTMGFIEIYDDKEFEVYIREI